MKPSDPFLFSIADLILICRKNRKFLGAVIAGCICLGVLYSLTSNSQFTVKGTYREKEKSQSSIGSMAKEIIVGGGMANHDSEAIAFMQSRKLLEPVVKNLNLQGEIKKKGETKGYVSRILDNLKTEYSYYRKRQVPTLKDPKRDLAVKNIEYAEEIPLILNVKFIDASNFEIYEGKKAVGSGKTGILFEGDRYKFTISHENSVQPSGEYEIVLKPLFRVVREIADSLDIKPDKDDKQLLILKYRYSDRHCACEILNEIMLSYQNHLKKTHDYQADLQLAYLERRRNENHKHFAKILNQYADSSSAGLTNEGFMDAEKEMEFLSQSQSRYREKLITNQLEVKRLQNVDAENFVYYDQYSSSGDPLVINTILSQIREFKQQRDDLELALKKSNSERDQSKEIFNEYLKELKELQGVQKELYVLITKINQKEIWPEDLGILQNPHLLIKFWKEKIQESSREEKEEQTRAFLAYLEHLRQQNIVHQKIINERLIHQQSPSNEFQGINFAAAAELFISYNKKLHESEASIRQNEFILEQMELPDFEIGSLGNLLLDPVSQDLIQRAHQTLLALKDESNRLEKEQHRLMKELNLQKNFLKTHVAQLTALLKLDEKLIRAKINSLKELKLELIHQQISLLEKSLSDYIASRLINLKNEKELIEQHLAEIFQKMAQLPHQRVSEEIIKQEMGIGRAMVEKVTEMVELKNISHHLEHIQSAPIDFAIPPLHPDSPRLLFFVIISGIFGACFGIGIVTFKALAKGLPATPENLRLRQQHVSGKLSKEMGKELLDSDLSTLRRLSAFFLQNSPNNIGQSVFLVEGEGPDYGKKLAELFSKKGFTTLYVSLNFDRVAPDQNLPGLLQFLKAETETPKILKAPGYSFIEAGGVTRYASELLTSEKFKHFLTQLKQEYDWVIFSSSCKACSAEAESLCSLFDQISVTISEEHFNQLDTYFNIHKPVSFIFS